MAVRLIRAEWRACPGGPTPTSGQPKLFLTGSFPLQLELDRAAAGHPGAAQIDQLGIDYLDRRNALIEAVTSIRRSARRQAACSTRGAVDRRPSGAGPASSRPPGHADSRVRYESPVPGRGVMTKRMCGEPRPQCVLKPAGPVTGARVCRLFEHRIDRCFASSTRGRDRTTFEGVGGGRRTAFQRLVAAQRDNSPVPLLNLQAARPTISAFGRSGALSAPRVARVVVLGIGGSSLGGETVLG